MLTSNPQYNEQEWTTRFVRFAVVLTIILLSSILIFVGLSKQAPL